MSVYYFPVCSSERAQKKGMGKSCILEGFTANLLFMLLFFCQKLQLGVA